MAWIGWTGGAVLWLAAWLFLGARAAATEDGDGLVAAIGKLLPSFALATCLGAFVAVPGRGSALHPVTLWAHHASFSLLFLFLLAAQFCQAEAWWRGRRGASTESVLRTYRRLWVLTETVPAPIALVIFLTGLRLIWESPGTNSLSRPWLLALVVGFSAFFWDGLLGYRPIVRGWYRTAARAAREEHPVPGAARDVPGGVRERLWLLTHAMSFPLLFVVGLARYDVSWLPVSYVLRLQAELRFLPGAWLEVATAVLLWAATGLILIAARGVPALGTRLVASSRHWRGTLRDARAARDGQ
jgi:hypothetical protein